MDTDGAMPGQSFSFIIDARGTGGLGDVIIDIVHDKQSVPYKIEDFGHMQYRVSFVPNDDGKYRVYVYFNGSDVRGSPFSIRVGTQKGSRRSKESTSSLERSKISSLERRMNGLNVSATERSSPTQKMYTSTAYKSISPTQRGYSPIHQTSPTYKMSSNYVTENSTTYHSTNSSNHTRSPNHVNHSPVQRNVHSPSVLKETKEIYSSSAYNHHSRSPNLQSPSFIKESKDIYSSSTLNRSRSPNLSPTAHVIKESRDIYNSGSLKRSRSPNRSPMTYRSATQSPVNRSFSPRTGDKDTSFNRRGSTDNGVVDTSSNVRVSSMVGSTSRRDSWDAIAKTKSLLSYGSLESLANLTNSSPTAENRVGSPNDNFLNNNNYKSAQSYAATKNVSSHAATTSYSSVQKSSSPDYGTGPRYDGQTATRTHGILKNKNNNYYGKIADTTDGTATHDRYLNNGGAVYVAASSGKSGTTVATGSALETLPVHRPTTFSVSTGVDPNKVSVTVTGKSRCDFRR